MSANFVLHDPALLLLVMAGSGLGLIGDRQSEGLYQSFWKLDCSPPNDSDHRPQFVLTPDGAGLSDPSAILWRGRNLDANQFWRGNGGRDSASLQRSAMPLFALCGISLVRIVNGTRQDNEWQTIAHTPLIIIIAVTAGDILTTLITG